MSGQGRVKRPALLIDGLLVCGAPGQVHADVVSRLRRLQIPFAVIDWAVRYDRWWVLFDGTFERCEPPTDWSTEHHLSRAEFLTLGQKWV